MNQRPEDSVLRRHYDQLQQAQPGGGGGQRSAASGSGTPGGSAQSEKGFLGRLLDKLFGA